MITGNILLWWKGYWDLFHTECVARQSEYIILYKYLWFVILLSCLNGWKWKLKKSMNTYFVSIETMYWRNECWANLSSAKILWFMLIFYMTLEEKIFYFIYVFFNEIRYSVFKQPLITSPPIFFVKLQKCKIWWPLKELR